MSTPSSRFSFNQVKIQHLDKPPLSFKFENVTVKSLARIFHLVPDTIILISSDGTVCVPSDDGNFEVELYMDYRVEGDQSTLGTSGSRSQAFSLPSTSGSWKPKSYPTSVRTKLQPVSYFLG